jgi:alpha,alpha-trehalase
VENITDLGELFVQVQLQSIFPDGKTFVDCKPKFSISEIRSRYEEQKVQPGFNLASFVEDHFTVPSLPSAEYESVTGRPITEHIELLWNVLTRKADESGSSLIPLPNVYVVPGGRFREMFYWDSYFTMLGLEVSGKINMIEDMVDNFSFLIQRYNYIPNGNRTYFLGRSQPPFYASMVNLLSAAKKGRGVLEAENTLIKYLPQLEKEYGFWMQGMEELNANNISVKRVTLLPDGSILNHYWDEFDSPRPESYKEDVELAKNIEDKCSLFRNLRAACESGWDFSSRWFKREGEFTSIHTTEIIAVDLNCLLFNLELTIANAYGFLNDKAAADKYILLAEKRKNAINKYCWNDQTNFYYDYDYVAKGLKTALTLAAVYPLFFQVAGKEMVEHVAGNLKSNFLHAGGLHTTTKITSQQWDSPNGWAPLQWIAVKGLINYGHYELAGEIATRWITLNENVYNNTGKMMEKYNVVSTDLAAGGGEYQSQDGFGWTNGVYLALKKLAGQRFVAASQVPAS